VVAGQRVFGENRVQEAAGKIEALADLDLEWHLIGHLQSNKAKKAAATFAWIESIDSVDLLRRVESAVAPDGVRPAILVQVDLAGEATKHGAAGPELRELIEAACVSKAVEMKGLMLVPPLPEDPEDSRPWFAQLRTLRDRLVADGLPANRLAHLSMGMSHDFEVAIEEGATMVRVGTAVFGRRPTPPPPGP
jgi:pyridoxal phosphate enzyme (YggS family)